MKCESPTRQSLAEAFLLGCTAVFLLSLLGRGFGPYWDSWYYKDHAEPFSRWISSWWDGGVVPRLTEWRFYYPKDEAMHPPLMIYGAAVCHAILKGALGELGSCRLFITCFSALWCSAVYLFLKPRLGRGLALIGVALLAGSPRFWVHAVLLNIDGLVASIYGLGLLAIAHWDHGWRGKAAVYLTLSLGFLTKLQAFYLVPILFVWVSYLAWVTVPQEGVSRIRQLCGELALAVGVSCLSGLTLFILWPSLWLDFPQGIFQYLQFITKHSNIPVLYFGTLYKGPDIPPWHYPWVYTAIALPLTLTVPVVVRFFRVSWTLSRGGRQTLERTEGLLWAGMLLPLLISSMPQAPKYDEVRLLLPAYGPMLLLCALEIGGWWQWLSGKWAGLLTPLVRRACLAAIGILILLPTIRIYPYNLVYFSPLIGGISGARDKGFDLEYLGVSMHRLNPALSQVARPGDILLLAGCNALVYHAGPEGWPPIPPGLFPVDFKMLREISFANRSVYAILSSRYGDISSEAHLVLEKLPPLATVTCQRERLFSLHKIPPEFVKTLPSELRTDQGGPSSASPSPR